MHSDFSPVDILSSPSSLRIMSLVVDRRCRSKSSYWGHLILSELYLYNTIYNTLIILWLFSFVFVGSDLETQLVATLQSGLDT